MELQTEEECQVLVNAQATDWTRFVGHILWVAIRQSQPADICWLSHHVSPNVHSGIYYAILTVLPSNSSHMADGDFGPYCTECGWKDGFPKVSQVTYGVGTDT